MFFKNKKIRVVRGTLFWSLLSRSLHRRYLSWTQNELEQLIHTMGMLKTVLTLSTDKTAHNDRHCRHMHVFTMQWIFFWYSVHVFHVFFAPNFPFAGRAVFSSTSGVVFFYYFFSDMVYRKIWNSSAVARRDNSTQLLKLLDTESQISIFGFLFTYMLNPFLEKSCLSVK